MARARSIFTRGTGSPGAGSGWRPRRRVGLPGVEPVEAQDGRPRGHRARRRPARPGSVRRRRSALALGGSRIAAGRAGRPRRSTPLRRGSGGRRRARRGGRSLRLVLVVGGGPAGGRVAGERAHPGRAGEAVEDEPRQGRPADHPAQVVAVRHRRRSRRGPAVDRAVAELEVAEGGHLVVLDERGLIQPADEQPRVGGEQVGQERGPVGALGVGRFEEAELVLEQDPRRQVGVARIQSTSAGLRGVADDQRAGAGPATSRRPGSIAIGQPQPPTIAPAPDGRSVPRPPPRTRASPTVPRPGADAAGTASRAERHPEPERFEDLRRSPQAPEGRQHDQRDDRPARRPPPPAAGRRTTSRPARRPEHDQGQPGPRVDRRAGDSSRAGTGPSRSS